ncbi:hypothetical protein KDA_17570 [Dictyobacter alpinus]|uniref:Uncharacterized protein n=1 Tax=Dictyobacter alpinus TaxID=2014873 RepID=A0A402B4J2_9CHLR|nr:WD40 repeat domain-containing protein [Dictyobacter alpinus]GCE26273.1 hypothetical protein KDA_17570 [Dictyobacter alpinus]
MNVLPTEPYMAHLRAASFELECGLLLQDQYYSSLVALVYADQEPSFHLSIACTLPGYAIQLWELKGQQKPEACLRYQEHTDEITALAWSKDHRYVASASEDRKILIWDALSGETRLAYTEQAVVRALAWSPDNHFLVAGDENNSISVLHTAQASVRAIDTRQLDGSYGIDALVWSPHGDKFASVGDDNVVSIWDAETGMILLRYTGHGDQWVLNLAWSPDGQWIASGADDIHLWHVETGACQFVYTKHDTAQFWIDQIAWSPDSKLIASSTTNNVLHIWNPQREDPLYVCNHPYQAGQLEGLIANALAWSIDLSQPASAAKHLAFASCNRVVSLIDISEEERE